MDTWENRVITAKGLALQTKLFAGNTLTITRAVTGTGYVTPALLKDQTAVSGEKQTLEFRNKTYPEESKCALPCRLSNQGLAEGYTAMQVGIYANDPDEGEILYAIAQATSGEGTVVPSETESPGFVAEWQFIFGFGQADSVELSVSPSYTATIEMIEELWAAMDGKSDVDLTNIENSDFAKKAMEAKAGNITVTTEGTGSAYTATIPGVTELYPGLTFNIIPHVVSASTGPTLNVNGTGALPLRQRLSTNTGSFTTGSIATWLSAGKPVSVTYDGTMWLVNHARPSATSIYGTMPIEKGGTDATTAAGARENLGAAPAYTYGTEDLEAGTSELETGKLHFVYE